MSISPIEIEGEIEVNQTEEGKREEWLSSLSGRLHVTVSGRKPIVDASWVMKDYAWPPLLGTELIVDVSSGTQHPFTLRFFESIQTSEGNAVEAGFIRIRSKPKTPRMQDAHREIEVFWEKVRHFKNLPRPTNHFGETMFQQRFIDYPRKVTGSYAKAYFKGDYHGFLSATSSPTNLQVLKTMIGMAAPVWERPDIYGYIEDMGLGSEPLSKLRDVEMSYRASQDALTSLIKIFGSSTVTEMMKEWYEQD